MKKKNDEQKKPTQAPQEYLEKILQLEIRIAGQITQAKENADAKIQHAMEQVEDIKDDIFEKARREREETLRTGIETAQQRSQTIIADAEEASKSIIKEGAAFVPQAVEKVVDFILGGGEACDDR